VRPRSSCPVNFVLETVGDRWSLLIIRDIVRYEKHTCGEFLNSDEKISANILADRLSRLVQAGILRKTPNPSDKRKDIYKLAQKGVDLCSMMLGMILWGVRYGYHIDKYYTAILPLVKKDKQGNVRSRMEEISDLAGP
jgi:DNA-binding HxlR family transcriptional regulator